MRLASFSPCEHPDESRGASFLPSDGVVNCRPFGPNLLPFC
jgi:hypothetical protein